MILSEAYAEILLPPGHKSISVKMGSPLRMSCLLHNLLEQPSYIFWYHGDRMINYVLTGGASVRHGRKGSELKIPRAQPSDAGDYMCVPSNARQANVYVNVTVPKSELLDRYCSIRNGPFLTCTEMSRVVADRGQHKFLI